ncbi:hypothetical protein KC316_g14916 [Hortaea werneckii]|nr:hypothetical protein KC324_g12530 [Hortaea werneckii]KAI7545123.1 hypothetical protein KC316_g14916 [Hortaea werneckii]
MRQMLSLDNCAVSISPQEFRLKFWTPDHELLKGYFREQRFSAVCLEIKTLEEEFLDIYSHEERGKRLIEASRNYEEVWHTNKTQSKGLLNNPQRETKGQGRRSKWVVDVAVRLRRRAKQSESRARRRLLLIVPDTAEDGGGRDVHCATCCLRSRATETRPHPLEGTSGRCSPGRWVLNPAQHEQTGIELRGEDAWHGCPAFTSPGRAALDNGRCPNVLDELGHRGHETKGGAHQQA